VLELEPNNKRAASMLDKVRLRGQRMRQATFAGGLVALAGIITAGVLLLRPDPLKPGTVEGAEPHRRHATDSYIIPGIEPDTRPPIPGETGGAIGSETGEPSVAETGESDDGGRTSGGSRPSAEVECLVSVTDLPAALLAGGDYALYVSGQGSMPLPASGELPVVITDKIGIRLVGATYAGSLTLEPENCRGGEPQILQAAPKPAKLQFQAGAIPLAQLSVSCVTGCSYAKRTANSFPSLGFPSGETEMVVELEFKAANYRSRIDEFKLTPGNNPIRINLEQLDE
jgi:eukaryotic-like serine/threonine-protein kinase